jgi:predicted nucleic acid-binding protein
MPMLIDSSVLIAAERGQLNFVDISARYAEEDVVISAVTASELLARRSPREIGGPAPSALSLHRGY